MFVRKSATAPREAAAIGFWEMFALTSFRDRNLFAASQAGLVNNLNDGMSWGIFPLFFAAFGLGVERIGILKAVYPATWGILQVATGPLSDRWGRKGLIVAGMWVQAAALFLTALTSRVPVLADRQPASRPRNRDGLSEPDRRCFRRVASNAGGRVRSASIAFGAISATRSARFPPASSLISLGWRGRSAQSPR